MKNSEKVAISIYICTRSSYLNGKVTVAVKLHGHNKDSDVGNLHKFKYFNKYFPL